MFYFFTFSSYIEQKQTAYFCDFKSAFLKYKFLWLAGFS